MNDVLDELDPIALYAIEQVAEGKTITEIAAALGFTVGALFARVTATAELQRRYWLAKETSAEPLESEMMEVARVTALTNPKAARVQIAALQWVLSKRCQRRYGDRLALDHTSPDGSMTPKAALDASKLSDETLKQLMAARTPETGQ